MRLRSFVFCCGFMLAGVTPAFAQQPAWDFGLSAARIDFDLSGTGSAAGVAARASRDVTRNVGIEVRGLFARPEQQAGPSTLFAPDIQVQYRWRIARLTPYAGGGVGFAAVKSPIRTDWDPTTSVAVGTGYRLTDRVRLLGEFRLRGFEWDYVGSTAEWSIGLAWGATAF
jgi:opacity protein-like surface antigen